jgi:hypothetical protein
METNNKQKALLEGLKDNKNDGKYIHVINREKKWAVRIGGASKAIRLLPSRESAISYAKKLRDKSDDFRMIVHKTDGTVDSKLSDGLLLFEKSLSDTSKIKI